MTNNQPISQRIHHIFYQNFMELNQQKYSEDKPCPSERTFRYEEIVILLYNIEKELKDLLLEIFVRFRG